MSSSIQNTIESVSPAQARSLVLVALVPLFAEYGIHGGTLREAVGALSWAAFFVPEQRVAMHELAGIFALLGFFARELES